MIRMADRRKQQRLCADWHGRRAAIAVAVNKEIPARNVAELIGLKSAFRCSARTRAT
jgi:hypothetical protein